MKSIYVMITIVDFHQPFESKLYFGWNPSIPTELRNLTHSKLKFECLKILTRLKSYV